MLIIDGGILHFFLGKSTIVPIEFRAIRASRDQLFPEKFVVTEFDTVEEKLVKIKAVKYIDDHIIHDAQQHFPKLLKGLDHYLGRSNLACDVVQGIEKMYQVRADFYTLVDTAILQ
jgi:hypothetical protein